MTENKKVFFGVDASSVEIKKLLNREFLELSLKAISDEKPNRNDTWFTLDALQNCKDSCYNKPILGFFKNNDFVSHNGKWSKDEELDQEYWDTLGEGERCIGLIRESDTVEVVEDEKGLHWLTFSCAIWTQYSYKQVKRLIKDALKAKKNGGPTKNISVEVDLTDYEEIEDPVSGKKIIQINSFELVGVTILGTRNGIKVEPGIEGAELSVLDIMNNDVYDKQVQSLRLAYEKLGDTVNNRTKEDFLMEDNLENSIVTEDNTKENKVEQFEHPTEETGTTEVNSTPGTDDAEKEPKSFESNTASPTEETTSTQTESTETVDNAKQNFEADPIYDLTYIINRAHEFDRDLECSINYYTDCGVVGGAYILALLKKHKAMFNVIAKESAEAVAKVLVEGYTEDPSEIAHEEEMCGHCDCNVLYSQFEAKSQEYDTLVEENTSTKSAYENKIKELEEQISNYSDYNELQEKVHAYEQAELLNTARELIEQAELSEEQATQVYEDCKAGKYESADSIKAVVAIMAFEAKPKTKLKTMYQAPVSNTPVINDHGDPETPKSINSWDVLKDYNGSKN